MGNFQGDQEKIMCNFQGSWFQALKFSSGVTQFCGVSRGEALFCLEFPWVKVKKLKLPRVFSKMYVLNPVVFFSRIAQYCVGISASLCSSRILPKYSHHSQVKIHHETSATFMLQLSLDDLTSQVRIKFLINCNSHTHLLGLPSTIF